MKVVLLGDWHAFHLWPMPWQWSGKRLAGQLNLWLNRRRKFLRDRAAGLFERIRAVRPDLLLLSGDLTTTSLSQEFSIVRAELDRMHCPLGMFAVPGNHDRYTFLAEKSRVFEKWITPGDLSSWPRVRRVGDAWAFVGVDPTRARLLDSTGRVGDRQREELRRRLEEIPASRRVGVLCHYPFGVPPGSEQKPGHRLQDAWELREILAGSGRPLLYFHGHVHEPWCWNPPEAPNVLAINAGAPLFRGLKDFPLGQGFWEFDTADDPPDNGPGATHLFHHHEQAEGAWTRQACPLPGRAGDAVRPHRLTGRT